MLDFAPSIKASAIGQLMDSFPKTGWSSLSNNLVSKDVDNSGSQNPP
jgi:hypothetical protein